VNDRLDCPQSNFFQKVERLFLLSTNRQVLYLHHFHKYKLVRLFQVSVYFACEVWRSMDKTMDKTEAIILDSCTRWWYSPHSLLLCNISCTDTSLFLFLRCCAYKYSTLMLTCLTLSAPWFEMTIFYLLQQEKDERGLCSIWMAKLLKCRVRVSVGRVHARCIIGPIHTYFFSFDFTPQWTVVDIALFC